MTPALAKDYLQALLEYQFDLLWRRNEPWGMSHVEFLFRQAAVTVVDHPDIRSWFLDLVRSIIFRQEPRHPHLLPEFILYFAHVSRWPELAAIATEIRHHPSDPWPENPAINWSSELSQALSDAWPDREFYPGLSHNVA